MDIMTKVSDTEIKITKTVEQVVSITGLNATKKMLENQIATIQLRLDKVKAQIEEAKALGVADKVAEQRKLIEV